ncbi:hypothetical protein [uncultured Tateyamaria sp.]|uniref:hypothetical protein n=1 Tax=uncultured Tateyamaria sp. TaxID=455651 RepID=UPI0026201A44|nr:hypothetical protein [uncultured Tateyamaria sp.]
MKVVSAITPLVRLFRVLVQETVDSGNGLIDLIFTGIQECGFARSQARATVLARLAQWLSIE